MISQFDLKELVRRIVHDDDPAAYKQLFLAYHKPLILFSSSITRCKESAEEVVSDVFLKLWIGRKALPSVKNVHLYLYVSTKNSSINRLLKQKREQCLSLDEMAVEMKSLYYDPEQLLISSETVQHLSGCISGLPPKCKMIFKLVKEDGLKYREVAELLHISLKTVESQMTIALRKIGQSIQVSHSNSILN
jgi:RNA polymerase sigma-70 factor (ECF subfamily)